MKESEEERRRERDESGSLTGVEREMPGEVSEVVVVLRERR